MALKSVIYDWKLEEGAESCGSIQAAEGTAETALALPSSLMYDLHMNTPHVCVCSEERKKREVFTLERNMWQPLS